MKPLWLFIFILLLCSKCALAQDESMLAGVSGEPAENRAGEHEFIFMRGKYANYQTDVSS